MPSNAFCSPKRLVFWPFVKIDVLLKSNLGLGGAKKPLAWFLKPSSYRAPAPISAPCRYLLILTGSLTEPQSCAACAKVSVKPLCFGGLLFCGTITQVLRLYRAPHKRLRRSGSGACAVQWRNATLVNFPSVPPQKHHYGHSRSSMVKISVFGMLPSGMRETSPGPQAWRN